MDDEKFSIDRFLELMGERDGETPSRPEGRPGRRRNAFSHALRAGTFAFARWLRRGRSRDDTTRDTVAARREVGAGPTREAVGGGADRREVLRAHALRGKPEDEPTSAGEMFHVEHFERGGEKEAMGGEDLRSAEALSDNGSQLGGAIGRLVTKLRGRRVDETSAVERARGVFEYDGGRGKSADDGAFAGRRDAGAVGEDNVAAWFGETDARGARKYRAEEAFRRAGIRRDAEIGEDVFSSGRPRGEKRIFADNDANLTESRSKIAEFHKSDTGENVDIRAISRAIERDARRY